MLFLYILTTLLVLTWILVPLFKPKQAYSGDPLMEERIQSLESALKSLYENGRRGISDEDFPNIERRLLLSLAKLLHQAGITPDQAAQSSTPVQDKPNAVREPGPPKPQQKTPATATKYCGQCGHAIKTDFAFCPQCGCHLNAA